MSEHLRLSGVSHGYGDRQLFAGVEHVGSLSGEEQERVALACVLAYPADILLLDEPTNHLDGSGTAWLEARLAAHRGTVVVVSHDRVLLRKVASTVIEVDAERRTVNRYGNGYEGHLREKAAERQRWVQQYLGAAVPRVAGRDGCRTAPGGHGREEDGLRPPTRRRQNGVRLQGRHVAKGGHQQGPQCPGAPPQAGGKPH